MELNKAKQLADNLMKLHSVEHYTFKFDVAVRRFGYCSWREKTISLSRPLTELNNEEQVKNTLLHEIAHALAPRHHHDKVWQGVAVSIGCNGKRCYDNTVQAPPKPFKGVCPNCGKELARHRRKHIACGVCCDAHNGGKYTAKYRIKWSRNTGTASVC